MTCLFLCLLLPSSSLSLSDCVCVCLCVGVSRPTHVEYVVLPDITAAYIDAFDRITYTLEVAISTNVIGFGGLR
jgi:hypothetical protein